MRTWAIEHMYAFYYSLLVIHVYNVEFLDFGVLTTSLFVGLR
jgi:hypothetical protein